MSDGGTVALDWTCDLDRVKAASQGGKPIVVILHGVTGGSAETYVSHLAEEIDARGWVAVVFNQRGCGASELTSSRMYCLAASWACADVLAHLRSSWPESPLLAVGFSLGANVLTKYVGEAGPQALLRAAVAVGNPLDTQRCGRLLDTGLSRLVYSKRICNNLKKYVRRHSQWLGGVVDLNVMETCETTRDFDDKLTAPAFGFAGAEDYYRRSASVQFLGTVAVPLLCVNSKDDPIAPGDPRYAQRASDEVAFAITQRGGHLAWVEGAWPMGPNWADRLVVQFFEKILS
eukprot:EG_transcript_9148